MASLESIRKAVALVTTRGRGHPYPRSLIAQVVRYAQVQRTAGVPLEKIGEELGLPWRTIRRWLSIARSTDFRAVEIVERVAPAAQPRAEVVVLAPHGVRVEGLDIDGIAELLRRLG
jgi:predicted transcriptional regulator